MGVEGITILDRWLSKRSLRVRIKVEIVSKTNT